MSSTWDENHIELFRCPDPGELDAGDFDADIMGLGVRLGFHLQTVAMLLGLYFLPRSYIEELKSTLFLSSILGLGALYTLVNDGPSIGRGYVLLILGQELGWTSLFISGETALQFARTTVFFSTLSNMFLGCVASLTAAKPPVASTKLIGLLALTSLIVGPYINFLSKFIRNWRSLQMSEHCTACRQQDLNATPSPILVKCIGFMTLIMIGMVEWISNDWYPKAVLYCIGSSGQVFSLTAGTMSLCRVVYHILVVNPRSKKPRPPCPTHSSSNNLTTPESVSLCLDDSTADGSEEDDHESMHESERDGRASTHESINTITSHRISESVSIKTASVLDDLIIDQLAKRGADEYLLAGRTTSVTSHTKVHHSIV